MMREETPTLPATTVLEFQGWTYLAATRPLDITSRKTAVFVATAISVSRFHPHLLSLHVLFCSILGVTLSCSRNSGQIRCTALYCFCIPATPRVSSSVSSSRGTIKLNPVTGCQCNTGSGGSSVGPVARLGELEFDS